MEMATVCLRYVRVSWNCRDTASRAIRAGRTRLAATLGAHARNLAKATSCPWKAIEVSVKRAILFHDEDNMFDSALGKRDRRQPQKNAEQYTRHANGPQRTNP